jgi:hypothetical protein
MKRLLRLVSAVIAVAAVSAMVLNRIAQHEQLASVDVPLAHRSP